MVLYVERIILEHSSFSNVMCRLIAPRGEIELSMNPISEEPIGVSLLVENLSFWKALK